MNATTEVNNKAAILEVGMVIADKWVILELIGKGAMGEVYRAHQLNLQRDVAIKVISRQWLESFDEGDQEVETSLQRFRREVQAMARIRHHNVLQVYDHGTVVPAGSKGPPVEFIVMEFIPGSNLRYTMSEEGFYPEEQLLADWLRRYFIPVLDGVQAVHQLEVIHRDLKPENILLDGEIPKIADFGLARSRRLKPLTQSMDMKGTLHYMSPEHFFDFRKADQRADIYSLGKILFEAVSGKFDEKTTPFRQVGLPEAEGALYRQIDRIIRDATAEKKEERIGSAAEFRQRLEAVLAAPEAAGRPPGPAVADRGRFWHHPRWIWAGVAIAVLSVAAMTVWHIVGTPPGARTGSPPVISRPAEPPAAGEPAAPAANQPEFHENGAVLRPIPAGRVSLPATGKGDTPAQVTVAAFEIEEAPVTNHQYVEFLNSRLSTVTVAGGVVREDNEIWLMLGEVSEGYEPIIFHKGRFHLKNAGYAAHPVLRVTAYGAAAYAAYYGRRLPTRAEWFRAVGTAAPEEHPPPAAPTPQTSLDTGSQDMAEMHAKMMAGDGAPNGDSGKPAAGTPVPITALRQNDLGIRLLPPGFGEWALREHGGQPAGMRHDADVVVLPDGVGRKPWEAFEEVGFRCVRPAAYGQEGGEPPGGGSLPGFRPPPIEGRTGK